MPKRKLKWRTRGIGLHIRRSLFDRMKRYATANSLERMYPGTMTAVVEQALEDYLDRKRAS
jgi:hypothetical protein